MSLAVAYAAPEPVSYYQHRFTDLVAAPFDIHAYSRMKFGSDKAARMFGRDLADHFLGEHYDLLVNNRCVVIPSPSTIVPVAATLLGLYFMNRLNCRLVRLGMPAVEWTQIHRNISYNHDYHHLDRETRRTILDNDEIYLNRDYVAGKCLLFIDDVRITGAHEHKLATYLRQHGYGNNHAYIALASYEGDDATIEARLNHSEIKNGLDVIDLALVEPAHHMTTRAIRLILELPFGDMEVAVERMTPELVERAYFAAINKSYHAVEDYEANFRLLSRRMTEHALQAT